MAEATTAAASSGPDWNSFFSGLLNLGLTTEGARTMQQALGAFGTQAQQGLTDIGQQAQQASQFVPFTVTSQVGQAVSDPQGGYTLNLTPEQEALRNTLFGGSQALAGQATAAYDPIYAQIAQKAYGGVSPLLTQAQQASMDAGAMDRAARQQQVYDQLRALQSPEEERQRLALENRLRAQGRLGTQTAQFGGTPEGLALTKAQEEAKNQAALMAMQQSGVEQQQAIARAQGLQGLAGGMFGMGTQAQMTPQQLQASQLQNLAGMLGSGYAPERELLTQLSAASPYAQLAQTGRQQGAGLFSEAAASGLEAQLQSMLKAADIEQGLFQSLAAAAGGQAGGAGGGLFDWLASLF